MNTDNRILHGVPEHEYRRMPGVNYSALKHMLRSPMHYKYMRDNPPEPTAAMRLGTMVHMAVLEPEKFAATYVECKDGDKRTKEYQAYLKKLDEANPGSFHSNLNRKASNKLNP